MSKRRRNHPCHLHEEEPDIHVRVHDREEPFPAHYDILRTCSSCVKNLPRSSEDGATTLWDLRELVLEGTSTPVPASVVQQWLDLVYSRFDSSRSLQSLKTADEVLLLLLFADAAGSCDSIIHSIAEVMTAARGAPPLAVRTPSGRVVKLALRGQVYSLTATGCLKAADKDGWWLADGRDLGVISHRNAFSAALCARLEEWLYLAGRLHLVPLTRLLMDFIKTQLLPGEQQSVLATHAASIYSPRVLQCMPSELLYEEFLKGALGYQPSSVTLTGRGVAIRDEALLVQTTGCYDLSSSGLLASAHTLAVKSPEPVLEAMAAQPSVKAHLHVSLGGLEAQRCMAVVKAALTKALAD